MKKVFNKINYNKNKVKSVLSVFILFSILKSLVYFAPLWMSSIVTQEVYGNFEYSINLGQLMLGFITAGFSGAYAYFIITEKQNTLKSIFHFHFVLLVSLNILLCCVFPSLLSNSVYTGFLIGLILANQLLMSTIEKLNGRNLASIVIDSFLYILLFIYLLYIYFLAQSFSLLIWNTLILLLLLLNGAVYHFPQLKKEELKNISGFKKVYTYGGLMIIAAPLVALNTASIRLYIEYFLGLKEIALFSFYYRVTTFSLLIYKVVTILLFRRIFTKEYHVLDNYFWKLVLLVFGVNSLVIHSSNVFLENYLSSYAIEGYNYQYLMLLCGFHVLFWINNAFLEPIFQRLNALKPYILINLISVLVLFGTMYLFQTNGLSIEIIVLINIVTLILSGIAQMLYLKIRNIYFKKLLITHLLFTGCFLLACSTA